MNLAVGFFDGVHRGHQRILRHADAVLTFRNHPLSLLAPEKAPALIMTAEERIAKLAEGGRKVKALEFTRALAGMPPEKFAVRLRRMFPQVDAVFCGPNWRFGHGGSGGPDTLRAAGLKVRVAKYATFEGRPVSSTRIRLALASGRLAAAAAMLGRPYSATGTPSAGKGAGRELGFPTLNFGIDLPLKPGAYAVDTPFGRGVANWGRAPTFGEKAWPRPVLEVHLLDAPPARPRRMEVVFLKYLRPERKFRSRQALASQIAKDCAAAAALPARQAARARFNRPAGARKSRAAR